MLFVALPFLLALWEYNLINIVKRMSVVKKNAYIGVDLGGTNMRAGRIAGDRLVAQGNAPDSPGRRGLWGDIGGFDRGDPFRVGRGRGSYRYRCAERGGS